MYKTKKCWQCEMPFPGHKLNVLVLNASLKHGSETSSTEILGQMVVDNMKEYSQISHEIVRLSDRNIPPGIGFRESNDDEWPKIIKKIKDADIIIFATPIWWGNRSSLMQRVIERMDALDEEYLKEGRSALLNKVAGVVIVGSEDGAQATLGSIMEVLTWFDFTLPPECCAYWVGEVGMPPSEDRGRMLKNEAAKAMAKNLARNLVYYAQLLKKYPMIPKK